MKAVALFGGTSEGRELAARLAGSGLEVCVYVATAYGEELLEPAENLTVTAGRLSREEMAELFRGGAFVAVVDATHPYAVEVTANLRAACNDTGTAYLRLLREQSALPEGCVTAADMAEAARLLETLPGRVLLTVGSKELDAFTSVENYRQRLFARVLPAPEVVEKCAALGFRGQNLICMQGPFSHQMNAATLEMLDIAILVTKDTGEAGGLPEKLSAAAERGVQVVLIRRPSQEEGYSLVEIVQRLTGEAASSPAPLPRFPLFVSLEGRSVLVVGGGAIAARRVEALLDFEAQITLVSPSLCPALAAMQSRFRWQRQCYGELEYDFALAIAATNDQEVNRRVGEDCRRKGIPVSVADSREESTFWFPALVRRGNMVAGLVSTDGDHRRVRTAAQKIRETLEEQL